MKGGGKKKDDVPEGKLRLGQVQTLPDEIDECIKFMQTTDYGVQDLDILVELSKQLKAKRQLLFPDKQYLFNLAEAGLTNDQIENVDKEEAKPDDDVI